MSPADVHEIAERVYLAVAPELGVHVLCRVSAMLALGICAAAGVPARLRYDREHPEAGGAHYWCELEDGSVIDKMSGPIRLREAPTQQPADVEARRSPRTSEGVPEAPGVTGEASDALLRAPRPGERGHISWSSLPGVAFWSITKSDCFIHRWSLYPRGSPTTWQKWVAVG
jgi:hypothetical protein